MTGLDVFFRYSKKLLLPYDAEVEYLQSTGTQWIDTGVKVTADCLFDFTVAKTRSPYNCIFFGTRNSGGSATFNSQCYLNANDDGNIGRIILHSTSTTSTASWNSGIIPVINQMYSFTGVYCVPTMAPMQHTMPLFAFYNVNFFNTANCACRIGYWKVYTQSEVLCDIIPVRFTNENNRIEGAMYDKVTKQLFRNQGTGSFVIGPDK